MLKCSKRRLPHLSEGSLTRAEAAIKGSGKKGRRAWFPAGCTLTPCLAPLRPVRHVVVERSSVLGRSSPDHLLHPAAYTWAGARRVLNRLAHIATGNISAWTGMAAAIAAPALPSVQHGSMEVVACHVWQHVPASRALRRGDF